MARPHQALTTSFVDYSSINASGVARRYSIYGAAAGTCILIENANATGDATGQTICQLTTSAPSFVVNDPSIILRYRVLSGSASAVFMDADVNVQPVNNSGPQWTVTAVKTGNYSAAAGELVQTDPSGGALTVTLPACSAANKGQSIAICNTTTSTTAVTAAPTGGDTVNGSASLSLAASKLSAIFVSDGVSNWVRTSAS